MTSNPDEGSSELNEDPSYDAFYEAHHQKLRAQLARHLYNPEDARDLAQETFLKILELDRLKFIRNPMAYLWTTARNALRKLRLQNKRVPVTYDSDAANHAAEHPENVPQNELVDQIDAERHVLRVICTLPPKHQSIVALCAEQLTVPEIASRLQLSEHTVYKYTAEAKAKIRTMKTPQSAERKNEDGL